MINSNFRDQGIDLLRGIAVFLVIIHHFHIAYHLDKSAFSFLIPSYFLNQFINNGYYGVTILFVISGFLITAKSLARYHELGKIDLHQYYLFRFARIIPPLLLALAIISIFNLAKIPVFENNPNSPSFILSAFSVLTFWHNILMLKAGWYNYCLNVYWSLSVTEVFYILFPLVCIFLNKLRFIFLLMIALIIIAPIYRSHYSENEMMVLSCNISCLDAFSVGCCAAIIAKRFQNSYLLTIVKLIGALVLLTMYFHSHVINGVAINILMVAMGAALILMGRSSHSSKIIYIISSPISWFGKNSYEIYLFHIIVLAFMKAMIRPDLLNDSTKLGWFTLFIFLTAVVAGNIAKYYSKPMNKILREHTSLLPPAKRYGIKNLIEFVKAK